MVERMMAIMHRNLIRLTLSMISLCTSAGLYAAPFFGAANSGASSNALNPVVTAPSSSLPNVMSPSEFSNKVNTLSQSVSSTIAQQASAALAQPPLTKGGAAGSTSGNVMTPSSTPFTAGPSSGEQPAGAQQNNTGQKAAPNPNTVIAPSESEEGSEPVFTGFGPGNTNSSPAPRSSGSGGGSTGGGWNVQY
jgi:hypothetical protein